MDGGAGPRDDRLTEGLADPSAPWEELVEDPAAPRALLAVMFTDIVGSTELATALGDKRWRELLEQHDAAVREQIARFDGREVDTAGDAFFATFGLAVRAVDCALESARAVRRLGLRIRAGIHMGECVVTKDKVRGVTVHIGARVGSKARGDEVLVSSTVRDILAGAGLKFVDRGEQALKGVDGKWRLYAVEPRIRDNEADLPPLLEADIEKPPAPVWKRRRPLVAALTALAVAIGAVTFITLRGGGLSSVPADSVAVINASSGDIESTIAVRRRPVGIAAAPDGVWVANSIDSSVTHITKDGRRDETIPVGQGPVAVVSGTVGRAEPFIWVANSGARNVSRVSPKTGGTVSTPIPAGNGLSAIAFGAGSLWLTNAVDGTVWRVDPVSGKTTKEIPVGPGLRGIAVSGDDAVWVTSETAGTVTKIDPRSGSIARVVRVGNGPGAVTIGAGSVWVANAYDGTVSRIDQKTENVAGTTRVGREPRAIAIASGHVFVANEESADITMIDARRGSVIRTIPVENSPMGLAASADRVWVSVRGGILNYKGGTLRVASNETAQSFDPGFGFDALSFYIGPLMFDGLTAFKRVGGPEGNQLVPNLVEELRPPTNDGKTYSYTLRSGLTYSDGTPVKASDVRAAFERTIKNEQYGASFLVTLKTSEKCTPKACDLSESIETNDEARTVTFQLRRQFSDFPYVLALPSLSIIPASAPPEDAGETPIPGTGPYRLASAKLERDADGFAFRGTATLERNPRFVSRGLAQPDAYADRIELTMGADVEENVEGVKTGRFDITPDLQLPGQGPLVDSLAAEFPSLLHVVDHPATLFATLNVSVPPFNDPRARQAFNYAIDRRALIRAASGSTQVEVSCQLLPENMIGYAPYCPYTKSPSDAGVWTGPDLDTAKRLVAESGTRGMRVTVWIMGGDSIAAEARRRNAPVMVDALNKIGYRASIGVVPGEISGYFEALEDYQNSKRQVLLTGWVTDYPGPGNYFLPIATCPKTIAELGYVQFAFTRYCDPDLDELILKALDLQLEDPAASTKVWAEADRALTDAAPLLNWGGLRNVFFVSDRVGNAQGHPAYVLLLSQMWVTDQGSPSPTPG